MKKSVLFLSFVAMIAMWSCGAKSNNGEAQGQDSTVLRWSRLLPIRYVTKRKP